MTLAILSKKAKFKKLKIHMDLIYIIILIYIQMTNAQTEHNTERLAIYTSLKARLRILKARLNVLKPSSVCSARPILITLSRLVLE